MLVFTGSLNIAEFLQRWRPTDEPLDLDSIYNENGSINYERVKDVAGRVGRGELEIRRLDRRGEQGRDRGGQRNVEASVILGAGERAGSQASRDGGSRLEARQRQQAREEKLLTRYAKQEGLWIDHKEFHRGHKRVGRGAEARVYSDAGGDAVIKTVDYKAIDRGTTPLEFLDRISLFNSIFPESPYELVGFTSACEEVPIIGEKDEPRFHFVVKQPFVHGTSVSEQMVVETMRKKGFEKERPENYANSLYKVHDLHSRNALQDASGNIFVFDAVPKLKEQHYQPFEIVRAEADTPDADLSDFRFSVGERMFKDEPDWAPAAYRKNYDEIEKDARESGQIKTDRDGTEYAIAPNGKRSNLPVHLWVTTTADNFKRWFGDWLFNEDDIIRIIGKDGKIDYEKAREIARGIIQGSITSNDEQRQQAQVRGGSRNVEASLVLEANERANPTPSRGRERFDAIRSQEKILERYAKQEGVWADEPRTSGNEIGAGIESRVYGTDDGSVRKFTNAQSVDRGVTPSEHLNGITSFNAVFPETAYTLEGFSKDHDGNFRFVTSQPFIKRRLATNKEIEQTMVERGFKKTAPETFENSDYAVYDLAPRNVLFNEDSGQAFIIDANVAQKAKAATPSYTANASKVIDENGEPLRVFHSTDFDGEIEVFDNDVVYFSKNRNFSGEFGKNTYEVFLNTRNPYNFDQTNGVYVARNGSIPKVEGEAVNIGWLDAAESTVADMQRRGFDGSIDGNGEFIVIFNPNQIKSTFNRGSFDDSERILKSTAPAEDVSASNITPAPINTKPGAKELTREIRRIDKDLKSKKVTLETVERLARTSLLTDLLFDRVQTVTIEPAGISDEVSVHGSSLRPTAGSMPPKLRQDAWSVNKNHVRSNNSRTDVTDDLRQGASKTGASADESIELTQTPAGDVGSIIQYISAVNENDVSKVRRENGERFNASRTVVTGNLRRVAFYKSSATTSVATSVTCGDVRRILQNIVPDSSNDFSMVVYDTVSRWWPISREVV